MPQKNVEVYVLTGNAFPTAVFARKVSALKLKAEKEKAKSKNNPEVTWDVKKFIMRMD